MLVEGLPFHHDVYWQDGENDARNGYVWICVYLCNLDGPSVSPLGFSGVRAGASFPRSSD